MTKSDILDLVQTLDSQVASETAIFQGDGVGIRSLRRDSPEYMQRLAEAVNLISKVSKGIRPVHYLTEALTTSDFPLLFADVIDRQILTAYQERPPTWALWCRRSTVPDFRMVKRFRITGGDQVLSVVPQETDYPDAPMNDNLAEYQVQKYGRKIPFAWETMINDDLSALQDVPRRYGIAARRTEEHLATGFIANSAGPDPTLFSVGNGNLIDNPLNVDGLQKAFATMDTIGVDDNGEPIDNTPTTLIVPPQLRVIAQNLLHAQQLYVGLPAGGQTLSSNQAVQTQNWMSNLKLAINWYLPRINTTNGASSWYLCSDPNLLAVVEMGFLRGHEAPEVFMKAPNAMPVGGGQAPAMMGDFDTDSVVYKLRHVIGGCQLNYRGMVASTGAGTET
jgi:hypothetical protein